MLTSNPHELVWLGLPISMVPSPSGSAARAALAAAAQHAKGRSGQKPKSDAGKGLPMEEENEYTGMTAGEMQRFLDAEAEQGASELEAYRKLMRILEVEFPSKE